MNPRRLQRETIFSMRSFTLGSDIDTDEKFSVRAPACQDGAASTMQHGRISRFEQRFPSSIESRRDCDNSPTFQRLSVPTFDRELAGLLNPVRGCLSIECPCKPNLFFGPADSEFVDASNF